MAKNWIQGAIRHPGALTRKAKAAGESPMGFARAHAEAPGRTGRQARLALTLQGLRSHLPAGVSLSPKGDLGLIRQKEYESVGKGFKGSGTAPAASRALPVRKGMQLPK